MAAICMERGDAVPRGLIAATATAITTTPTTAGPAVSLDEMCAMAQCCAERIEKARNVGEYEQAEIAHRQWSPGDLDAVSSLRRVISSRCPEGPSRRLDIVAHSLASHPAGEWCGLGRNVRVRVLLPCPASEAFVRWCLSTRTDPGSLVAWLSGYLSERPPNWEVRLSSVPVGFGATFVDQTLFVQPRPAAESGPSRPTVVLRPDAEDGGSARGVFHQCEGRFETLWRSSARAPIPYVPPARFGLAHRLAAILAHDGDLRDGLVACGAAPLPPEMGFSPIESRQVSRLCGAVRGAGADTPLPGEAAMGKICRRLVRPAAIVDSERCRLTLQARASLEIWRDRAALVTRACVARCAAVGRLMALADGDTGNAGRCVGACWLMAPSIVVAAAASVSALASDPATTAPAAGCSRLVAKFDSGSLAEAEAVLAQGSGVALVRVRANADTPMPDPIPMSAHSPAAGEWMLMVAHVQDGRGEKTATLGRVTVPSAQCGDSFAHDCEIEPTHHAGSVLLDPETGEVRGTSPAGGNDLAVSASAVRALLAPSFSAAA